MKALKIVFITVVLTTGSFIRAAQQPQITGTVTDSASGEVLPAASVVIEGTQNGTITNSEGRFSILRPSLGSVIIVTSSEYKTLRIVYNGETQINVKLSVAVLPIEQIVVIGYGSQKRSDVTGAISKMDTREIERTYPENIQSALQGRASGLMITSNSGAPGSEGVIRVRGIGTVNNNDPIFVVDGMIIENNDPLSKAGNMNFLNPIDIASIEILKDASAQAIYGSRGANGVILVTTKKGKESLPQVKFMTSLSIGNILRTPEVLDTSEYKDYILTSHYNGYLRSTDANPNVLPDTLDHWTRATVQGVRDGISTYWPDEVLKKNVVRRDHYLSLSGGSKLSNYLASAGYHNQEGLFRHSYFERYTFRLNTEFKIGKFIAACENLGIASSKKGGPNNSEAFRQALDREPVSPVLKDEYETDTDGTVDEFSKYDPGIGGWWNPVLTARLQNLENSTLTLVGNVFAEATILRKFKIRSSWGFNRAFTDISDFVPIYYLSSNNYSNEITLRSSNMRLNGWVWENTMNYHGEFKKHSISALLGNTAEYSRSEYQNATKGGIYTNFNQRPAFDAATSHPDVSGGYNTLTQVSYLGRIHYSYNDKYLLTASLRGDGSSRFGSGHRWGWFPSFSAGWRISEEELLKDLNFKMIRNIKLRAGWGVIGNSNLPKYFAYVTQISNIPGDWWVDNRYIFDETDYPGYFISTIGTPDLTWETTEQLNLGLDISVLKNSLSVTADYYIRTTKNLLLQAFLLAQSGYPETAAPYYNAGNVRNKGFEFTFELKKSFGNFAVESFGNASIFRNKVTSLGRDNKPIIYWVNRTVVGKPIGSFYGYKTDGIFQTEEEVQNYTGPNGTVLQPNAHAGDFRFKNINNDENIGFDDIAMIGNPWPKMTFGFNLSLGYKAFDLVIFLQGSYGNDIYRNALKLPNGFSNIYTYMYRNAWRGQGSSNTQPILTTWNQNDNSRISDYFVEDGSYLRLKNLQLGYSLPGKLRNPLKMQACRIWIAASNLLTFTKYRGIDPETGISEVSTLAGLDNETDYPKIKEISMGISVDF